MRVFERILPTIKRRSLIVILSDCFDRIAPLATALKQFRHTRNEVILFHVVAPEEEDFPFKRPTKFHSLERPPHHVLVDPHQLRTLYLQQYREFCEDLVKICGTAGVDYQKLVTSQPYHLALGAFLEAAHPPQILRGPPRCKPKTAELSKSSAVMVGKST